MGVYKNSDTDEVSVTVDGSRLDKRRAASKVWVAQDDAAHEAEDAVVTRPADSASKAAWVEYAVSKGVIAETAETFSRDELVAMFPKDGAEG